MNNIDSEVWGPLIWSIIHITAYKYNNSKQTNYIKKIYKIYILSILPCNECKVHYKKFINNMPFNPTTLKYKLYTFHNDVSKRIHKKTLTCTCNKCLDNKYSNLCCSDINKNINKLRNYYYSMNATKYIKALDELSEFLNKNNNIIFH